MTAAPTKDLIVGHGDFRYKVDTEWGRLDQATPVKNCHEMVQDSKGRLIQLTNHIRNNVIIYNKDGKLLDQQGRLKHEFGGPGKADDQFLNAHGIAIDTRDGDPKLLITAREKNQLKYFDLEGNYLSTIDLPGAYICRPVIHRSEVYLATIWSGDKANNSGFVSILDQNNRVVSAPGGLAPAYKSGKLQPTAQALTLFKHPHDVCVDDDENLYIPQWNAGQVYPFKLHRV